MVKLPWKEAKTGTAVSPVEATGTNTAHGVVRIPAVGSRQIRPSLRPTAASAEPDGPVVFKCPGVPQLDKAVEPDQDALRLISADTELSQMSADEAGDPPGRVISDKHFRVALLEIRPSANEEGTLPELRKVSGCLDAAKNNSGPSNSARVVQARPSARALASLSALAKT
jgi:hypothetical protein